MSRKMKDSGVEWIGEIPGDWNIAKLKRLLNANDGGIWGKEPGLQDLNSYAFRSTEQTVDGKWNIKNPTTRSFTKEEFEKHRLQKGDLLITKSSGSDVHIGKTTLVNEEIEELKAVYSNFMQRIRPNELIISNYLWYCFNNKIIREQFVYYSNSTTGLSNISAFILDNINIPFPNIMKQQIIADFLDIKTSEIDTIVEKTRKSIEELKAYKQSLITETVTKGLNPDVPMKDSGIEWISKIPEHWEVNLGKRIFNREERPKLDEEGVITAFRDGEVTLRENRRTEGFTHSSKEIGYQGIRKGDLVIHGMDAFAGAIGVSDSNGKSSPVYIVLSSSENINNYYYAYLLKVYAWNGYIESMATGIRQRSTDFRYSTFSMTPLVQPTIEEQNKIVEFLNKRNQQIDNLVSKKEKMIKELESYKQSLIYEYVTGKKEVE